MCIELIYTYFAIMTTKGSQGVKLKSVLKTNEMFDMQAMIKISIHNTDTAMQNKQTKLDALFRRFPTF